MTNTVLIVDDSPTAGPELRTLLEREGYTVLTALRAEEALDMLQASKIDIVVTEALLPTVDGFELVRRIRELPAGAHVPIIMLTVRSAPEDYAASFDAGANEYFLKPMEPPKLLAAIRGLLRRYEMGKLDALAPRQRNDGVSRLDRGQITTVFSLKGGVGTSTIAVNTAIAIKQAAPSARVAIIDLSLEDGHVALLLDIVPTSTIVDWAQSDPATATPNMLNQYFVMHASGVAALSAPPSPEQAEMVRAPVVRSTLELAMQAFDYIVVDTASTFSEISLIALDMAQTILIPVTPDMAAVKSVVNAMRILKAVKVRLDKVRVLQNEIVPRAGLTKEQLEASVGKNLYVIPHAGPYLIEAANQGTPVVTIQPPSPTAKAIIDLARTLCVPEFEVAPASKVGMGLFGERWQGRFKLKRA